MSCYDGVEIYKWLNSVENSVKSDFSESASQFISMKR